MLKMSRILCATKTSYTKPDLQCFGEFRGCFIYSLDHFSFVFSDGGPAEARGVRLNRRFADLRRFPVFITRRYKTNKNK